MNDGHLARLGVDLLDRTSRVFDICLRSPFTHFDRPVHARFLVSGDQAGELERACVRERPDDFARRTLVQPDGIGIIMLHIPRRHHFVVLCVALDAFDCEFMLKIALVRNVETDRFTLFELE